MHSSSNFYVLTSSIWNELVLVDLLVDFIAHTTQGRLSTVTAGTCMTKQISRLWIKGAVYNLHTIIKNMESCIGKLHFSKGYMQV